MKSIVFLPENLQETSQIVDFPHPRFYDDVEAKIKLILSNNEDINSQDIFWFQETKFGKSPEGKDLTVKSTFFHNISDPKKGGILKNDSVSFCTPYDMSFSLISHFFKENKLSFLNGEDRGNSFESVNDIHLKLYEKHDENWKFVKTDKIKECLLKICQFIEEGEVEESKETFFKVTKESFLKFIEHKMNNIADNFPQKVKQKVSEIYPTLDIQNETVQKEARLFFGLELLSSFMPNEIYVALSREFETSLYQNFYKYQAEFAVSKYKDLKEQEVLLNSARNVGAGMSELRSGKGSAGNGNSSLGVKKRKTVASAEPKKVTVGALDGFFRVKK